MSTYRKIHGRSIQAVTTDPTGDITEGQIWYNTDSDTFKTVLLNQAWSSSSNMTTARRAMNNGFGAQNSGVAVGGYSTTYHNNTEEYNGTGWASSGNYPASLYYIQTSGTETAGLAVGGGDPVVTTVNEYNGSSWTSANGLPTATKGMSRAGTQTASIYGGGFQPSTVGTCYLYDGTNWTSAPSLNTARGSGAGSGAQTDAVFYGGGGTGTNAQTEEFNGSSWSEQNDLPTAKQNLGFANDTTSTSAIGSGGYTPPNTRTTTCFKYDGTSWSTIPSLSTAKAQGASGAGTADGAYFAGGTQTGTAVNTTEEYNSSANVVTAAVFASGGTANTSRRQMGYTTNSPQNDFMGYGGFSPGGFINNSETYDGTSWTEGNNLNDSKGQLAGAGVSSSAALAFGGNSNNANTEEYNGTSWTEVNNMNNGRYELGGCGIQTAALACGGDLSPPGDTKVVNTEEYDGTNWTTGGNLNTARRENDAAGTQTAAIVAGGGTPSGTTATETYNGSAWTTVNSKIRATVAPRTMGGPTSQTAAVTAGGHDGSSGIVGTEQWNGTSFATGANMNQQRFSHTAGGSIAAGIVAFGDAPTPAMLKTSEEFTGETSALNVKTLTQS